MAVWSKTLPLTASHLLPVARFESQPGHAGKLTVTGLGGAFSRVLQFPPPQGQDFVSIGQKITIIFFHKTWSLPGRPVIEIEIER